MVAAAGGPVYASDINLLLKKPIARLRSTVAQSVPSGTWTSVTFDVEDVDTDPDTIGGHSTSSNTSRYTARYAGWYRLGGGCGFAANTTNRRGTRWAVNGTAVNGTEVQIQTTTGNEAIPPARGDLVFLNVGDYVELQAFQNSGVALLTAATTTQQPSMAVTYERQS